MSHRRAKFTVSRELLLQVLCLPADTQVLDARAGQGPAADDVLFVVEHPDLKELRPGDAVPVISPQFKAEYDERSTILPKFVGWGQT